MHADVYVCIQMCVYVNTDVCMVFTRLSPEVSERGVSVDAEVPRARPKALRRPTRVSCVSPRDKNKSRGVH